MKVVFLFGASIIGILCCCILYTVYDANFSEDAVIGKRNHTNAKKLKRGMSLNDVYKIMGKPENIGPSYDSTAPVALLYPSNNGDYLRITVYLTNDNNTVVDIFNPE